MRAIHRFCVVGLIVIGGALVSGCAEDGENATARSPTELDVGTTVAPITSIAANIGGDRVKITGIVPEGTNSHTFEPKPSVAELLSQVDVLYVNGLKLEEPTSRLAEQNLKDGAEIVELGTKAIRKSEYAYDFSFPRSAGKPNPHLWTHPKYALKYAATIRDELSARDPAGAAYFKSNYDALETQITPITTGRPPAGLPGKEVTHLRIAMPPPLAGMARKSPSGGASR